MVLEYRLVFCSAEEAVLLSSTEQVLQLFIVKLTAVVRESRVVLYSSLRDSHRVQVKKGLQTPD